MSAASPGGPGGGTLPGAVGPADRHGRLAPSPQVLAAIEAAVAEAWPRPAPARQGGATDPSSSWRFSGRWWVGPLPLRRERPR